MIPLLLLHAAVLPLFLLFCSKHHDERTPTVMAEQGAKNEGLKKEKSKRLENLKKEEQTDQKNKKQEVDKGVVHDEKDYQKKVEGNKASGENGKINSKDGENTTVKFVDSNPDYHKLMGLTKEELTELNNIHWSWFMNEKEILKRHAAESRRKEEERMKRGRERIIEEGGTQSSSKDPEEKAKKETSNKGKSEKSI